MPRGSGPGWIRRALDRLAGRRGGQAGAGSAPGTDGPHFDAGELARLIGSGRPDLSYSEKVRTLLLFLGACLDKCPPDGSTAVIGDVFEAIWDAGPDPEAMRVVMRTAVLMSSRHEWAGDDMRFLAEVLKDVDRAGGPGSGDVWEDRGGAPGSEQ